VDYESLLEKTFNLRDVVQERKIDGVPANLVLDRDLDLLLDESAPGEKKALKEIYFTLMPEDVFLEECLVPSVKGSLLKCNYFIEVSFTHAGLGGSIPKIVLPI
jgi:hypothetical protein